MIAVDGSAVGFWVTVVVVTVSLVVIIGLWGHPSASCERRWKWLTMSAVLFSTVGATWFGRVIRSDLQYEPPDSNHYSDYKFLYDAAPWFGGLVGLLVGVALALVVLLARPRRTSH